MKNSIIICTSDYKNIDEIKEKLGEPIFYRFNNLIKFDKLTKNEQKILDPDEIK